MTITREFRRNRQRVTDPDGVVVLVEVSLEIERHVVAVKEVLMIE